MRQCKTTNGILRGEVGAIQGVFSSFDVFSEWAQTLVILREIRGPNIFAMSIMWPSTMDTHYSTVNPERFHQTHLSSPWPLLCRLGL